MHGTRETPGVVRSVQPADARRALDEAVTKLLPDAEVDRRMLYMEFRLALNRKFKQWENVPNAVVDAD